ncbi:glycosyltransferase [Erythrobacter aquimaris]|uniref:Glycosyltransferase n=1 Tax=Qipengyuania aquimaris TaxID=255984 RepID=A0A6I4TJ81_9SPHN|nr:glycosyltransferase family 4 protein [Qipengyuania aquimaris]MXO95856.1 glycosyltransferase [Qipengyuania aquimaris]
MRILVVHNYYGSASPSGENQVVETEVQLLRDYGHEVAVFDRHSDSIRSRGLIGSMAGALSVPWNPFSAREMRDFVASWKPDILHAHNTFPLISPSIFPAAAGGPARVMTLHNYRLLCAAGIPMRDNHPCTLCIKRRTVAPAMRYGCYRESKIATLPLAAGIALHRLRNTWQNDIEAFVALTEFQRDLLSLGGIPATKIEVKPNFYPGNPEVQPWKIRGPHCVFVGRLSEYKGIVKLIRAWRRWGKDAPFLHVIGDGPLREKLLQEAREANVIFDGQLTPSETERKIANARLLILPSECFEGFPMVIREAFAFGTPVAVSDLGPLPSIVDGGRAGFLLDPFDEAAVTRGLRKIWSDQAKLRHVGEMGHLEFRRRYTAEANLDILHGIYSRALERRKVA